MGLVAAFVAYLAVASLGSCGGEAEAWLREVHASAGSSSPRGQSHSSHVVPVGSEGQPESEDRTKEYKVKAALLFNFLKYATFPPGTFPNDKSPIKVLIVGTDPFGPILNKLLGKQKIGQRSIQISRVGSIPKEVDAQLVFTAGLDAKDRATLAKRLEKKPVLLVGENPGFCREGGFINLYMDGSKVRFEINSDRQSTTGIKLNAELLKLARIVKSDDAAQGEQR